MADTDEDLPQADDAIRKDAISLTNAYECIAGFISDHPELLPKFDEDWSEALRKSKEEERKFKLIQRRLIKSLRKNGITEKKRIYFCV